MRTLLSLAIVRTANRLLDLALRIAPTPTEPRPRVVWSTMGDDEIAAHERDEILSAAFRGVIG